MPRPVMKPFFLTTAVFSLALLAQHLWLKRHFSAFVPGEEDIGAYASYLGMAGVYVLVLTWIGRKRISKPLAYLTIGGVVALTLACFLASYIFLTRW